MPTTSQPQPDAAPLAVPAGLLARAFARLEVPEALTVSEAALKYRVLNNPGGGYSGPWSFDQAPHVRRPMDCLTPGNPYTTVAVMGGAQSAKSAIGDNWMLHGVICDSGDVIFLGPDKDIQRSYVISQINKMLADCPALRARQLATKSADNIFTKQFAGTNWFFIWPVVSQLRARPAPKTRVDDLDAVPENIDGEGSALVLLAGRQTTFEGFEKTYVNSSPALGPRRGIEALVRSGTNERYFVPCVHCGEFFPINFHDHLKFDRAGSPEDASDSAVVACPDCGGIHEQRHKQDLMIAGTWLGPDQSIDTDGNITGDVRRTTIASFNFDGLMGFLSWGRMAADYRAAELAFERSQDEHELRAFENTRVGRNYFSRVAGAAPVEADELAARAAAAGYRLGTVPAWVKCLTAAVDVQGNRFEIMVMGWGPGYESCIVDRFAIIALDDGTTAIKPHGRAEHWGVLIRAVLWRRWPVADNPEFSLGILNAAVDTGGIEGVTDNAFAFWHTAIAAGVPDTAITLLKGGNNPKARLLPPPTVDAKRQIKGAPEAGLYIPNVNRIKDTINVRLHRPDPGPGYIHLPSDLSPEHTAELVAEEKMDGLWVCPDGARNETLDLAVYNITAMLRLGGTDSSLAWLPDWAGPQKRAATVPAKTDLPAPPANAVRGAPRRRRVRSQLNQRG